MRLHSGLRTAIHGGHMNDSGFFSWKNGFSVSLNSVAGVAQSRDVLGLQCRGRRRGRQRMPENRGNAREIEGGGEGEKELEYPQGQVFRW